MRIFGLTLNGNSKYFPILQIITQAVYKYSRTLSYKMYFIYSNKHCHINCERRVVVNLVHEV